MADILYKEESFRIIGACMQVHKKLGSGFLESVYSEALEFEFKAAGILFEKEKKLPVYYENKVMNIFGQILSVTIQSLSN